MEFIDLIVGEFIVIGLYILFIVLNYILKDCVIYKDFIEVLKESKKILDNFFFETSNQIKIIDNANNDTEDISIAIMTKPKMIKKCGKLLQRNVRPFLNIALFTTYIFYIY